MVASEGALNSKLPSKSVITPLEVPFSWIETPISGSFNPLSITRPFKVVLFCPQALNDRSTLHTIHKNRGAFINVFKFMINRLKCL